MLPTRTRSSYFACFDKYTCDFALQCQLDPSSLITTEASLTDTGILNHSLDSNVFNNYNIVYLLYCTGDLFVGNKYLGALFIDSIADKTQYKFNELVLMGITGYPFAKLLPGDEFHGSTMEILNAYSLVINVTRFNIASDQHVWLTGNDFPSA
ncbi:hypothetical protein PI125_g23364 [Phytophthora idaei]|nr:hypothetical protein PI125_g23364 [Phytophthora idaei]